LEPVFRLPAPQPVRGTGNSCKRWDIYRKNLSDEIARNFDKKSIEGSGCYPLCSFRMQRDFFESSPEI
jgi:hypothetical protein